MCLHNIREFIRGKLKHGDEEHISYVDLQDKFYEILNDNDVVI